MKTIIGTKGNMTQVFVNDRRVPVTKIMAGPCTVTQLKKEEKDGYWAVQFGINQRPAKNTSKPLQGHLKSTLKETKYPRNLVEIRLEKEPEYKVGDVVNVSDILKVGDVVEVSAVTKGKGFQGGMKRHGFHGGPKTHGQSDRWRAPGSVGQTTTPGRVYKGKRMAGRMGGVSVTVKNLHVVSVDKDLSEVLVSGPVPGRFGSIVTIHRVSAGSLKDLEKEAPAAQIIEGEAPKGEETNGAAEGAESKVAEVKQEGTAQNA